MRTYLLNLGDLYLNRVGLFQSQMTTIPLVNKPWNFLFSVKTTFQTFNITIKFYWVKGYSAKFSRFTAVIGYVSRIRVISFQTSAACLICFQTFGTRRPTLSWWPFWTTSCNSSRPGVNVKNFFLLWLTGRSTWGAPPGQAPLLLDNITQGQTVLHLTLGPNIIFLQQWIIA